MNKEEARDSQTGKSERQPYQVRLPGFITDEDIGLGDVIKRATSAISGSTSSHSQPNGH